MMKKKKKGDKNIKIYFFSNGFTNDESTCTCYVQLDSDFVSLRNITWIISRYRTDNYHETYDLSRCYLIIILCESRYIILVSGILSNRQKIHPTRIEIYIYIYK